MLLPTLDPAEDGRLTQAQLAQLTALHRDAIRKLHYDPTFTSFFCITLAFGGEIGRSRVHRP
jgi:hypothetical protein